MPKAPASALGKGRCRGLRFKKRRWIHARVANAGRARIRGAGRERMRGPALIPSGGQIKEGFSP